MMKKRRRKPGEPTLAQRAELARSSSSYWSNTVNRIDNTSQLGCPEPTTAQTPKRRIPMTNPEGTYSPLPGGSARFQIGASEPAPTQVSIGPGPAPEPRVKITGATHQINIGGDGGATSAVSPSAAFYSPDQDSNGLPGFLASGRNPNTGLKIAGLGDVRDNTEFNVDGVSMPASSAAKAGLLVKNPDGSYSLPDAPETNSELGPDPNAPVDHLSKELRGFLNKIDQRTGSVHATEAVVTSVINHQVAGDMDSAAKALASRVGIEPEVAKDLVQRAHDDAYSTAAAYVTKNFPGIKGEEVFEWLAENLSTPEKSSLAYRMYLGDKSAFQEGVTKFKRAQAVGKA